MSSEQENHKTSLEQQSLLACLEPYNLARTTMYEDQEYVEFENVKIVAQTDKAALLEQLDGEFKGWFPWSQIGEDSIGKTGEVGCVYLTEWICKQKEVEY